MVLLTFKRLCTALKIWPCLTAAFLIATAIASPSDTAQKLAEREQPLADAAATSTAESTAPHFPVNGGGNYFSNPEPVALWTGQTSIRDLIGPIALRNANKVFFARQACGQKWRTSRQRVRSFSSTNVKRGVVPSERRCMLAPKRRT